MHDFRGTLCRMTASRGVLGALLFAFAVPSAFAQESVPYMQAMQAWEHIKQQLSGADGEVYFDKIKGGVAGITLTGIVVEGKPFCAPKEILVFIRTPTQQGAQPAEITLKLDRPLRVTERREVVPSRPLLRGFDEVRILGPGKLAPGSTIEWRNIIPEAFTKSPFMLTLKVKMVALLAEASPCTLAPESGRKKK